MNQVAQFSALKTQITESMRDPIFLGVKSWAMFKICGIFQASEDVGTFLPDLLLIFIVLL